MSYGNTLFKKTSFQPGERDYRKLVANLILKTEKRIRYDAINVGEYDLTLGMAYLKRWQKRLLLPLISSNLTDKDGKGIFKPYLIVKIGSVKIGIIGLIKQQIHWPRIPDGGAYKVLNPFVVARRQAEVLKSKKVDLVILLTDMTAVGCQKIAHLNLPIDMIFGSYRYNRLSLPKITRHRIIIHLDRYGKHIGKFSLICPWNERHRFSVDQIPGKVVYQNAFAALSKDLPKDRKISDWMGTYIARIRMLKKQMAFSSEGAGSAFTTTTPHLSGGKRYVGAKACKKCHPRTYLRWKKTSHGHAFLSIVKKGNQYDPDCIGCHTTGFEMKGGFKKVSKTKMMTFVNVQCEACHGPGSLHVQSEGDIKKIQRKVPSVICLKCHTEEHSPDFIYQVYLARLSCTGRSTKLKARRKKKTLSIN